MVNKAALLNILESIKTNTIASNDGIICSLLESATDITSGADIFAPNAIETNDGVTRFYSLYDGNEESINKPEYKDIPKERADSVFVRYFDATNDRVKYISNWIELDIPPDENLDDHRFTITDHDGRVIDVTDLEWQGDIQKVNLTKLKSQVDESKPTQPQDTQSGGFRLWYIMIETGRDGETEGKGDRIDHRVCVMATPRQFPTKPFMLMMNTLPGVTKIDFQQSNRAKYIIAEIPQHDMRVLIMEMGAEPKIYPSDDMLDITQNAAAKFNAKAITVKSCESSIIDAMKSLVEPKSSEAPPEPKSEPKRKSKVHTVKQPVAKSKKTSDKSTSNPEGQK